MWEPSLDCTFDPEVRGFSLDSLSGPMEAVCGSPSLDRLSSSEFGSLWSPSLDCPCSLEFRSAGVDKRALVPGGWVWRLGNR